MSSTTNGSAEQTWDQMNARAESTQAFLPGAWSASDTAARPCGSGGAQWVISRIGPGTPTGSREATVAAIHAHWKQFGWEPVRSTTGGDAPSTRLRYPGSLSFDDGFFIDFETTVHGSTLALQTPCAPGDYDALNRAKYGERHTNTPPFVSGITPSLTAGATS